MAVPGAHLGNFAKWKNEAVKIIDDVFVTDMANKPKLMEPFRKAIGSKRSEAGPCRSPTRRLSRGLPFRSSTAAHGRRHRTIVPLR